MVECSDAYGLPVIVVMAVQAIRSQATLVLVLMAGYTTLRKSKKCTVEILNLNSGALVRRNAAGVMTPVTIEPGMLAFEGISRLLVIKVLDVPFDQGKVFAIVLGVAAYAFLARSWLDAVRGM